MANTGRQAHTRVSYPREHHIDYIVEDVLIEQERSMLTALYVSILPVAASDVRIVVLCHPALFVGSNVGFRSDHQRDWCELAGVYNLPHFAVTTTPRRNIIVLADLIQLDRLPVLRICGPSPIQLVIPSNNHNRFVTHAFYCRNHF